jgi:hypothetical protein
LITPDGRQGDHPAQRRECAYLALADVGLRARATEPNVLIRGNLSGLG